MKNAKCLLPALFTGALALAQTGALADSAIDIQNNYAPNSAVTYDDNGSGNYPIVTAILSMPGTVNGYTYNYWRYLAADTTGSMDMFYKPAANTGSYTTPTVGDTIIASGNWSPFDGIPEIANSTANPIVVNGPGSQGNSPYPPGGPVVSTIPTVNVGTNSHGLNASGLAGYYIQLDNVMIGATGNFPGTGTNLSTTITDQHGNSMTAFFWSTSYSTIGAMGGTPIPQGLVDVSGFVDDFGNSAEFIPISVTSVPEPSTLALSGLSSLLAIIGYRLRKKA